MTQAQTSTGYPFFELMWTMLVLFCWIIWFWLLIVIFGDLFRRSDISGWGKAGWTVVLLALPLVGVLIYLVAQGKHMGERRYSEAPTARERYDSYIRPVPSRNHVADQIAKAKQLLDNGAITDEEFQEIKRKALAS
ncbi:SHOCT domain-containing protein [Allokutzneria oryzae]|uniref:SHOCT domain-containing protein n=1 Tax=Allokutzneria oryzae TaxID=1378989 RepID=A0ABV6A7M4_9PSEU